MGDQLQVSGIVLAGGMSRRLGRQKALEPLGALDLSDEGKRDIEGFVTAAFE